MVNQMNLDVATPETKEAFSARETPRAARWATMAAKSHERDEVAHEYHWFAPCTPRFDGDEQTGCGLGLSVQLDVLAHGEPPRDAVCLLCASKAAEFVSARLLEAVDDTQTIVDNGGPPEWLDAIAQIESDARVATRALATAIRDARTLAGREDQRARLSSALVEEGAGITQTGAALRAQISKGISERAASSIRRDLVCLRRRATAFAIAAVGVDLWSPRLPNPMLTRI